MSLLDPLRFFQRSHAARVNDRAGTGDREDECSRGNLVFPGRDIAASIELEGQRVGRINYGISPLKDRIFVRSLIGKDALSLTCDDAGTTSTALDRWLFC